jgi:predicted ATPase
MSVAQSPFRIDRLSVRNYKGIDELDLEFPRSQIADDPDIVAIGSRNGVGKSSVLECCALLLAIPRLLAIHDDSLSFGNVDDIVRTGQESLEIRGQLTRGSKTTDVRLTVNRNGDTTAAPGYQYFDDVSRRKVDVFAHYGVRDHLVSHILGNIPDPVILPDGLLFHSFRRVSGGHMKSDTIFKSPSIYDVGLFEDWSSKSAFKGIILREMMYKAGLIENAQRPETKDGILDKLNALIERYVGGRLGKLRIIDDDEIDIRIDTSSGFGSYTFNGLSSGQMEIISTLFLIWFSTRDAPSVVLIDEPELHLNAEWHASFVSSLVELAPDNQYILATHSEDVMSSVSREHRIILASENDLRP